VQLRTYVIASEIENMSAFIYNLCSALPTPQFLITVTTSYPTPNPEKLLFVPKWNLKTVLGRETPPPLSSFPTMETEESGLDKDFGLSYKIRLVLFPNGKAHNVV